MNMAETSRKGRCLPPLDVLGRGDAEVGGTSKIVKNIDFDYWQLLMHQDCRFHFQYYYPSFWMLLASLLSISSNRPLAIWTRIPPLFGWPGGDREPRVQG